MNDFYVNFRHSYLLVVTADRQFGYKEHPFWIRRGFKRSYGEFRNSTKTCRTLGLKRENSVWESVRCMRDIEFREVRATGT